MGLYLALTLCVRLVHRLTGLSPPVNFFDSSKVVLLMWIIYICYLCLVLFCFLARVFVDDL